MIAGLQRRLLLLLVVVLLPVFAFFVVLAWQGQRDELAQARERLQVVSRLAALGAERHVEGARQLLNAISSGPSLKDSGLGVLCTEFLANIRRSYPYYSDLGFITAEGRMVCHAASTEVTGDLRTRSYFTQAMSTKAFSMGLYQTGQVTSAASVGFATPVYGKQHDFKGLAYAGLEIAQLAKALNASLPPGLSVTLADRQGTIIAVDISQSQSLIGTPVADNLLAIARAPLTGEALEAVDANGVATLYGLSAVRDDTGPAIYVVASQPRSAITAPAWRALTQQLLWISLMALLGVAMARWIANRTLVTPARSLLTRINQLGSDAGLAATSPAPGSDAMGSLSSAFDQFAQLLRQRDMARDRQQAVLQTVQGRLLVAQRIANIGNWELDLASQNVWWSDQTYAVFGVDPASFTPSVESLASLIFPADLARFEAATHRFFKGDDSLELECRMVGRGGRIRWIRKLGEIQFDRDGHPVTASGTVQDITDRVINERLMAAEASALLALSLNKPLSAVLEEVLTGLNAVLPGAYATILLLTADGQRIKTAVSPSLPASFCGAFEGEAIGPAAGSCGTAAYRRETVVVEDIATDPLWANYRGLADAHGLCACWSTPVMNAAGAVLATFAIYYRTPRKPLTEELELAQRAASVIGIAIERDRSDAAFRASELLFRNSFLGASAGMVISTLEGRVVEANSAYCRMLGYTASELYQLSARDLVHPKDLPQRRAHVEALKTGETHSVVAENRYLTKTGETVWIRVSISMIRGVTGLSDGFVLIAEDINEQRKTMQALQQTQIDLLQLNAELEGRVKLRTAQLESVNKELEAFSYSVSHDLRAPLQTVSGFLELLDRSNGRNLTDKGKHYVQRIRTGSVQMSDLIQGLMSLAELNRKALNIGPVNLSALAQRVEQDCRDSEPDRAVEVHIQPCLQVHGDATLLMVVMQNLFANAWKYTSKQDAARIDVGVQTHADGAVVYFVRDNGAGFDMVYADLLFGAFQRLHAAADFSGTGIGLANVKRVISRHGGRVWAEGQPGLGATFYFTLAAAPQIVDASASLSA